MKTKKREMNQICINCKSFFPADDFPTEDGIYLMDESFDPYIDELIDNNNFDCCMDLLNRKKFMVKKISARMLNPLCQDRCPSKIKQL